MSAHNLSPELFRTVVECTPLVSIDLIVRDEDLRMLVGLRSNRPAKGKWFVPGGRIFKNERMDEAFGRISRTELGLEWSLEEARPVGVFEHFYDDNFSGATGYGTHYVVLAYTFGAFPEQLALPKEQHDRYRWLSDSDVLADPGVHDNTKAYARLPDVSR